MACNEIIQLEKNDLSVCTTKFLEMKGKKLCFKRKIDFPFSPLQIYCTNYIANNIPEMPKDAETYFDICPNIFDVGLSQ